MLRRAALVVTPLVLAGLLGACSRPGRALPEARLFVSPDLPGSVVADAAARLGAARVTLVGSVDEAELAWLSDPADALGLGARAAPGSAPAQEGVPERFLDPRARFAPLPARARVLLVGAAAGVELPSDLRDVAGRALKGKVALVPFGRGEGPVTVAALAVAYGREVALEWLAQVEENAPQLAEDAGAVRARVASGAASVGLAGSIEGAAGAASAAGVRVVYPDQAGAGAIVIPTALVRLPGAGDGATRLAEWLAGPAAERVLVARVPGLLPLRENVPVPVGVEPTHNLAALSLDWDRLAEEKAALQPVLEGWPAKGSRASQGD